MTLIPSRPIRVYAEINPWFIGKYAVCYDDCFGRFQRGDWCVVDDFGNLVVVE
jgi:hypothetical protein